MSAQPRVGKTPAERQHGRGTAPGMDHGAGAFVAGAVVVLASGHGQRQRARASAPLAGHLAAWGAARGRRRLCRLRTAASTGHGTNVVLDPLDVTGTVV